MLKILTFSMTLLLLSSCFPMMQTYKTVPIQGNYAGSPYEVVTDKSKEEVWDNLIDLFAKKGLPIKLIDKSSGLIISEKSLLTHTHELPKGGGLSDKTAYVVLPKVINKANNKVVKYSIVTGDWNVRIKEVNGKTVVNVNLLNIVSSPITATGSPGSPYGYGEWTIQDGKSTGVFEKMIADTIK